MFIHQVEMERPGTLGYETITSAASNIFNVEIMVVSTFAQEELITCQQKISSPQSMYYLDYLLKVRVFVILLQEGSRFIILLQERSHMLDFSKFYCCHYTLEYLQQKATGRLPRLFISNKRHSREVHVNLKLLCQVYGAHSGVIVVLFLFGEVYGWFIIMKIYCKSKS